MLSDIKVSLQISLAPNDYLHAKEILPSVLKILYKQVDEVLLIVETRASKGRFAVGWEESKTQLDDFFTNVIIPAFCVKIIRVDYSKLMKVEVGRFFFGSDNIPDKDYRGGPFYGYFFGLFVAKNELVFHLDSDIFLGGHSQNWIAEAVSFFINDPSCLIVSPLPGPPHPQGLLIGQSILNKIKSYTFHLEGMSTRVFMIDKSKFGQKKLEYMKPNLMKQIKALIQGNPNAQLPEIIISSYMEKHNLKRIDFLGSDPGLWSLHPPYRTRTFYNGLKQLIQRIERGELPAGQMGFYDVIDEVCDWTEAREKLKDNRWWKKYLYVKSDK